MRTGDQASRLVAAGCDVTWWTSRFDHKLKQFRQGPMWHELGPRCRIALLDGPRYPRNMSWQRVRHYRRLAAHFEREAEKVSPPSLILGSYPSPELCDAGRRYAKRHRIPFVVDIRDPWPDIFPDYAPVWLRWSLLPVLWYYRSKIRSIARDADGIVAVSEAMLDWGLRYAARTRTERDRVFHIGFRRPALERALDLPIRFTPNDPLVCLFATTCGSSYDGGMLVDAAWILERAGERRVKFVVSGDGDMRRAWMARAAGLQSVQFTGWISHEALQAHFERAHLGLVLMRGGIARFWLGNKIFEYLSSSLGIVNDAPGELADIVRTRDLGLNVERGDAESLARALQAIVEDPARVLRHMACARASFLREFDREKIETQYTEYVTELIERGMSSDHDAVA